MIKKGFTLIELLIVIAVLGTLAAIILVALNPLQQLAKARDTGRQQVIVQLGKSLEGYAVSNSSTYVATGATWITTLVATGEMTVIPSVTAYSISGISACTTNAQNGYCYNATTAGGGAPMIVYARLESQAQNVKCAAGTPSAYFVYSSADGRAGLVCRAAGSEPVVGIQTFIP